MLKFYNLFICLLYFIADIPSGFPVSSEIIAPVLCVFSQPLTEMSTRSISWR